jgi:hypothetical protein
MYLSEFLVLMTSTTFVMLLLMLLGEKLITILALREISPFYKIVGSLILAIGSVAIVFYIFTLSMDFYYYLLAGAIILLNKYWLGHFTIEESKRIDNI